VNKFFDRVYELALNELSSNQSLSNVASKSPSFSSNSPELNIIQNVVKTGEILNIQNGENNEYKVSFSSFILWASRFAILY
jgi:hypothetical protein